MSLIKPKAPRWYREENGVVEACYTMPKKNGDGMKEPNITDARELGLLPSVTTILSIIARPGLERWKKEQVIYSAVTLPRERESFGAWDRRLGIYGGGGHGEGPSPSPTDVLKVAYHNPPHYTESDDVFAARVVEDSEAQAGKAAEFGSRIHDAIAEYLAFGNSRGVTDPILGPYLESFIAWTKDSTEQVHAVEKVVGGKRCGYAGRLDLDCTLKGIGRTIVDVKTQGIKEGKSPIFYEDSWLPQLAAYRDACDDSVPRIMSLVIDSRAPGPVWPRLWESHEVRMGTQLFHYCRWIWMILNDYNPTNPREEMDQELE